MPLTTKQCENAEIRDKPWKLKDSGGLYLLIQPNGAKYWRLKYRHLGKEKLLALGVFNTVSVAEAREKRDTAKKLLANGVDPATARKEGKRQAVRMAQNTFQSVAIEWIENGKERWSKGHAANVLRKLELDVFPVIGSRPIAEIAPPELLDDVLRKIEKRGAYYMASRIKQICGQIFRYGIGTGRCTRDPSADLRGILRSKPVKHFASLEAKDFPPFLAALNRNEARLFPRTIRAMRLLMLTFTRTSELIKSTWDEFDLEHGFWEIPAERMKMGASHIVPLSRQAIALLNEQRNETGHINTNLVFPGFVDPRKSMSNNTILQGIYRLGFKGDMTGHGFRAFAMSTIKERLGYRHEVVDRQLSHAPGNKIDRAYDRAKFLDERAKMMQEWSDFLDSVSATGTIPVGLLGKKTIT